jgi:hypothetical protein
MRSNPVDDPAALRDRNRAVWVELTNLYRLPIDESRDGELRPKIAHELRLEGEVAGTLHEWTRSARGLWLGVVTFAVPFADDRSQRLHLQRQLVPAYALRPKPTPAYRPPTP